MSHLGLRAEGSAVVWLWKSELVHCLVRVLKANPSNVFLCSCMYVTQPAFPALATGAGRFNNPQRFWGLGRFIRYVKDNDLPHLNGGVES